MSDISSFDPNSVGNPNNNIFGLPFTEEESDVVLLPVPWEVTVSYTAGTARAAEHILKASLQVDLIDSYNKEGWKKGFFMRDMDKKILMKSDYLRKEAELLINYISQGENLGENKFMCKIVREVNEGSDFLNQWVYEQTMELIEQGKRVGVIGGDHSTPLGFMKAIGEKFGDFGILQIDAHCDLREAYEEFTYSHASIMYNALKEIPGLSKLIQLGIRDYSPAEVDFINENKPRVTTYFDHVVKQRLYEGETWKQITEEIVDQLPRNVYFSFDIDGLDPKLCPHTGTPVFGGFEAEQVFYLFQKVLQSGRKLVGFDLSEVGTSPDEWDENVGARVLFKLCNLIIAD